MGLLHIIRKIKEKEKEVRILVLGLDNAGKTTIVKKFNGEDIDDIAPTLGFQIKSLYFKDFKLSIWDVGGQKSIRSYWKNFFEQTDGLIFVVDSSDKSRLDLCKSELHDLLKQEKLAGATLLIFYNKSDIEASMTLEEIVEYMIELSDTQQMSGLFVHSPVLVSLNTMGTRLSQKHDSPWKKTDLFQLNLCRYFIISVNNSKNEIQFCVHMYMGLSMKMCHLVLHLH